MVVHDYGKIALQVAILGALVLLRLQDAISAGFTQNMIFAMVGYLFGNGVNAIRKQAPSPVLVARTPPTPPDVDAGNAAG